MEHLIIDKHVIFFPAISLCIYPISTRSEALREDDFGLSTASEMHKTCRTCGPTALDSSLHRHEYPAVLRLRRPSQGGRQSCHLWAYKEMLCAFS